MASYSKKKSSDKVGGTESTSWAGNEGIGFAGIGLQASGEVVGKPSKTMPTAATAKTELPKSSPMASTPVLNQRPAIVKSESKEVKNAVGAFEMPKVNVLKKDKLMEEGENKKKGVAATLETNTKGVPSTSRIQADQAVATQVAHSTGVDQPNERDRLVSSSTATVEQQQQSKRFVTVAETAYGLWQRGNGNDETKNWNDAVNELACMRAHEIWLETGHEDSEANYTQAKQEVIEKGGMYL